MALPEGWTTTTASSADTTMSGIQRDPEIVAAELKAAQEAMQGTRNKIVDLYNSVGQTYADLVNAGRDEEAASLRDAAQRFARAGSQTGVSSDARIAALQDLAGNLRVAGQKAESEIQAASIGQSLDILKTLAGLDQTALNNAFGEAYNLKTETKKIESDIPTIRTTSNPFAKSSARSQQMIDQAQGRMAANNELALWLTKTGLEKNAINQALRGTAGSHVAGQEGMKIPGVYQGWSGSDNTQRQWGEPLVSQSPKITGSANRSLLTPSLGGGGTAANPFGAKGAASTTPSTGAASFTQDGKTYKLLPNGEWGQVTATPASVKAKRVAAEINTLPTGALYTAGQTAKNIVTSPFRAAQGVFDWMYGNK